MEFAHLGKSVLVTGVCSSCSALASDYWFLGPRIPLGDQQAAGGVCLPTSQQHDSSEQQLIVVKLALRHILNWTRCTGRITWGAGLSRHLAIILLALQPMSSTPNGPLAVSFGRGIILVMPAFC